MLSKTYTLVTGGSGLIGSAIVRKLLDLDHDVSVFDIKESKHKNCKFFRISWTFSTLISKLGPKWN